MPRYRITSPSGKVYNVNTPEGTTQQQALAYVQKLEQKPKPAQQKQSWGDYIHDWANLLTPGGVAENIGSHRPNQVAAGLIQGAAHVGDQLASKLETGYNSTLGRVLGQSSGGQHPAFQKMAARTGPASPSAKTVGEIATAGLLTKGVPGGAFGQGAAANAIMSDRKDPASYGMDVLLGGVSGWGTSKALNTVAGLIGPKIAAGVRKLADRGVQMTPGQIIPALKKTEDKLMSRPGIGDVIEGGRQQSFKDFTKAVAQEALDSVGAKLPANLEGRAAVKWSGDHISGEYEKLIPKLRFQGDAQLRNDLVALNNMANDGSMSPQAVRRFNNIVQNQVVGRLVGRGATTGAQYRAVERSLSQKIATFGKSQAPDDQFTAEALKELQGALQSSLQRSNPQAAGRLQQLNEGWAKVVRVENAMTAAREPFIAPGQFWGAMKSADASTRHRAVGRGQALMQDLAEAGVDYLPSKYPDSGTAGRHMQSMLNPNYYLGMGQGLLYRPGVQKALSNALLAPRPQAAEPIADLLRSLPAGPLGAPLLMDNSGR